MKHLRLSILLVFSPLFFYAQQLTGLWMGKMTNDSNTIRKDDEYEIVLTQYKDKVYGYTRNTFFVDENLYYIVKRVEGNIIGDRCEVKDEEIIMHNFPQKPEKKVKVTYTFLRNTADSSWNLEGDWKTNQTKKYYSISGKSDLNREKDLTKSKLFPHLEELNKTQDIAFYNNWKKDKDVAQTDEVYKKEFLQSLVKAERETNSIASKPPQKINPAINVSAINNDTEKFAVLPEEKKATIASEKMEAEEKKNEGKPVAVNISNKNNPDAFVIKPEEKKTAVVSEKVNGTAQEVTAVKQPVIVNAAAKNNTDAFTIKPEPKSSTVIAARQTDAGAQKPGSGNKQNVSAVAVNNKQPVTVNAKPVSVPVQQNVTSAKTNTETKVVNNPATVSVQTQQADKPIVKEDRPVEAAVVKTNSPVVNTDAAKAVADRDFDQPQEINFTSDSLVLALYDNGEVDGDTVSVLLNGEIIIAKQCLKTVAFKKTIYIPSGEYQANIVLYAENLGIYPPNTGLLVVYDGEERYNVRFSADYKKNSAIILKRKK